MEEGMFQVKLGKFLLTVDAVTYENLQDQNFARQYLKEVEQQVTEPKQDKIVIWTLKKPTEVDTTVTSIFLDLRKQLKGEFADKKHNKNQLWLQIAEQLNSMGYYVGDSVGGREKYRQKFMNLQATFFKYKDQIRQTGEGFIKKPQFYEDLEEILGDTHKANPAFVIDSSFSNKTSSESLMLPGILEPSCSSRPSCSSEQPSTSTQPSSEPVKKSLQKEGLKNNRLTTIKKTTRPRRTVLTTVENVIREERTVRQQQFQNLLEAIKEQNEQRHQQTMGLIQVLKEQKKQGTHKAEEQMVFLKLVFFD